MHRWAKGVVLGGLGIAIGVCPGLSRADYYSYTQENGTKAYTDDAKRVPARYKDSAQVHAEKPLADYERFTATRRPAAGAVPERYASPDEALRGIAARDRLLELERDEERRSAAPRRTLDVEAGGLTIPIEDDGDEPIFVERNVYRWLNGRYTPFTIVRRGNRVISEIAEARPY